jgi:hypothetical protein
MATGAATGLVSVVATSPPVLYALISVVEMSPPFLLFESLMLAGGATAFGLLGGMCGGMMINRSQSVNE